MHHHDFKTSDFFSWIVKMYNYYYLPKMFAKAQGVCFFGDRKEQSNVGIKMLKDEKKAFVLGLYESSRDIHNSHIAEDLILVYNSIILTNTN